METENPIFKIGNPDYNYDKQPEKPPPQKEEDKLWLGDPRSPPEGPDIFARAKKLKPKWDMEMTKIANEKFKG